MNKQKNDDKLKIHFASSCYSWQNKVWNSTEEWLTEHTLTSDSGFVSCWCSSLHVLYLSITDFMLFTRNNYHFFNLFHMQLSEYNRSWHALSWEDLMRTHIQHIPFDQKKSCKVWSKKIYSIFQHAVSGNVGVCCVFWRWIVNHFFFSCSFLIDQFGL